MIFHDVYYKGNIVPRAETSLKLAVPGEYNNRVVLVSCLIMKLISASVLIEVELVINNFIIERGRISDGDGCILCCPDKSFRSSAFCGWFAGFHVCKQL